MTAKRTSKTASLYRFIAPYRWQLLRLLGLTTLLSVLAMAPPLVTRAFIDRVIGQGQTSLVFGLGFCLLALPTLITGCGFLQTRGIAFIGQHFVFHLRCALYQHLMHMSLRFYSKHSTGMLVNRLMGDSSVVANMMSAQTIGILSDLVCSTFAITATFALNWRMALLISVVITTFLINYHVNIRSIRKYSQTYWQSYDRLSGGVQNRLAAALAVKSFGAESREHRVFQAQSETSADLLREAGYAGSAFNLNTSLLNNVGRSLLYFLGCAMVLRGDMSYGDVLAFTSYAMQLLGPALRFSELARQLQDVRIAMDRILEIYREQPEVTDRRQARAVDRLRGQVDFDQVTFYYNPGRPVIQEFNLHVAAGETVALVGPTGCGKSTLLLLLMRFFDVIGGQIRIDGHDVRDLRLKSLRNQFGIVLQDPLLFNISLADNIRYSNLRASQADIEAAARVAEIHEFIMTLPEGYQTVLGAEGLQLSVGQKQRLTIARAVLANPAILIMDEATSALDSESERAIQQAMQRVLKNRTSFIVAHRLSTIRDAHRIVLIRSGRITEMGNHETLLQRPEGAYRRLYEQFRSKGVIEDESAGG